MPKYRVTSSSTIEVEAEDEEQAIEKAKDSFIYEIEIEEIKS